MREIKFRAWDVVYKKMIFSDVMIEINGKLKFTSNVWTNNHNDYSFKLMQFTGLHDKNGKEIYEGDIFIQDRYVMVMQYKQDEARFQLDNNDHVTSSYFQELEVIGNIYENPELLEGAR